MNNWLALTGGAVVFWGIWGFISKLATNHIDARSVTIYNSVGVVITAAVILALGFRPEWHNKGTTYGVLTGVFGTLGGIFFLFALTKGKVSVVLPAAALYPVLTTALAVIFLRERLTRLQGVGVLFALAAVLLFSL